MSWSAREPRRHAGSAGPDKADRTPAARRAAYRYLLPILVRSVSDLDVLENAEGVGDQDGRGVVGADEVLDDGLVVDAHETHRQAGLVLVGDPRLVQADHALLLFAEPHDEDRGGGVGVHRDLVAREDRDAAPGGHRAAVDVGAVGVEPALVAL